jgi:hypothetical protein
VHPQKHLSVGVVFRARFFTTFFPCLFLLYFISPLLQKLHTHKHITKKGDKGISKQTLLFAHASPLYYALFGKLIKGQ